MARIPSNIPSMSFTLAHSVQSHLDDYVDEHLAPVLTQLHRLRALVFKPNLLTWDQSQLDILDSTLGTMLADIRERRNNLGLDTSCVGTHSLPEEILCIILECLVDFSDDHRSRSSVKNLVSALGVCRRWYRVPSAKASIWRGIDLDIIPPKFLHSWLDRCATTPLSVWTSRADPILSIRDDYRNFPAQVVSLTLRKNWYLGSKHRDLVNSTTFPNVIHLYIADYPAPDAIFTPPSMSGFTNLRTLDIRCECEFWATDGILPIHIEYLTIHIQGVDALSRSRLAHAVGHLHRLRRFVFDSSARILASDADPRMWLPALEYVHLVLNPLYHHLILDILPTFDVRAYHLLLREKEGEMIFNGPKEFTLSVRAILQGHTTSFTRVRFTLGLKCPIMSFEGTDHFSVSVEEHSPFGKRHALLLELLDTRCIREVILAEDSQGNPRFYGMGEAYGLLRWVERLVLEGEVGPEASRLLIALGGRGSRIVFPDESSYSMKWPSLSSIDLHAVDNGLFYSSRFDDMQGLCLAIWSMEHSGVPLETIRITKTDLSESAIKKLEDVVPNVIVEPNYQGEEYDTVTDSMPEAWQSD